MLCYEVGMKRAAAVTALAALAFASTASAAAPTQTKWIDRKDGFSAILPPKWYPVPRTVAAVQQTIASLKKQKKAALASEYSFYLTAPGRAQLKDYVFQAFLDISPSTDPIAPQFAVQVSKGSKPYTNADLPAAGRAYASALAQHKGAKISAPKRIELPAGPAQFVTGTVPAGTGIADGFELYLLIHKGKLYALKFDVDASILSQAKVLRSIAEHFAWV
jgi:hypothetical protein